MGSKGNGNNRNNRNNNNGSLAYIMDCHGEQQNKTAFVEFYSKLLLPCVAVTVDDDGTSKRACLGSLRLSPTDRDSHFRIVSLLRTLTIKDPVA
jgi:hypothetical protein